MKPLTATPTDETEIRKDDRGSESDLPDAVSKPVEAPKWGPVLPVTPRTAFMSVRGLA